MNLFRRLMMMGVLAATVSAVAPVTARAQEAEVFGAQIPVLTGRKYNILSEILIPVEGDMAGKTCQVKLEMEGIRPKAVRSVKLMYSGTMSVIGSRTSSFVLKDVHRKLGGGQDIWCDPDFVMEAASTVPVGKDITLNAAQPLNRGDNYFYISMEVDPETVEDLSQAFTLKVTGIDVEGRPLSLNHSGTETHRLGTSVRQHGDDGSDSFRIPGLVTTNAGSLVGVYDVRWDSYLDLQSNVDIGVSRSTDGGRTWEKMRIAMDMGTWGGLPEGQNGIGDPAILVDEQTGDLLIVAVWTHGISADRAWTAVGQGMSPYETAQLMVTRSTDDGQTWSTPENITPQVKDPEWFMTLQGPGRGISMEDGTLVFPMQHIGKDRIPNAGIMYSQDHGKTWQRHEHARTNTTEAQVVEIEPGVLMLNMRDNRRTGRAVSVTRDFGRTWEMHPSTGRLIEPVCMGSLLHVKAEDNCLGRDLLLFSNPATQKGRHHTTIKASLDKGYTWSEQNSVLLDGEENWGYSCLTLIDENTVGILYECSTSQLVFQAVRLTDIVRDMDAQLEVTETLPVTCGSEGYGQGVSGAFLGCTGSQLITAGGANFPEGSAAEGGRKHFYKDIHAVSTSGDRAWRKVGELPQACAYGATFTSGSRVVFAGGANGNGTLDKVYAVRARNGKCWIEKSPSLPEPVEQAAWATDGDHFYLAGGLNNGKPVTAVYRCDLNDGWRWTRIAELPEPSVQPVMFVHDGKLWFWCGYHPETLSASGKGYCLDLAEGRWTAAAPVPDNGTMVGATAAAISDGRFFVTGGTDRHIFEEGLRAQGAEARSAYLGKAPANYKFQERIRIFDPATGSWSTSRPSGKMALAGAAAAQKDNTIYLLGGEIQPGVRSTRIWKTNIK